MNKKANISPERFFPVFAKMLWGALEESDFGFTKQSEFSAIITVRETILCTIDILGHIVPDQTFLRNWPDEYDRQQDQLIFLFLTTLHNCLNRLTIASQCISVDENTLDLLAEEIYEYSPTDDDDEPTPDDDEFDDDEDDASPGAEHSGFHFLPPEDEVSEPEDCPDITLNICARKPPLCWGQITAGVATGLALGAAFFRRRR